jgi:ATP-dependent exoDNAse (exonuclease V) beta subunit
MFDYKTNKEIKRKNPRKETLLNELNHLQQCEYAKYSLQLSLYSTIIEKITEFKVPKSYIVWVNGEENYELIECLDLKKECLMLLDQCK